MYTIYLILDAHFGEQVLDIAQKHHVWLCDTEINRLATANFKSEHGNRPWNESGITLFQIDANSTQDDIFLDIIRTVAEHHTVYSHNPTWQKLVVIGAECSEMILADLNYLSPGKIIKTSNGFEYIKVS